MGSKKFKILEIGDPVLRQKAKPVTVFHKKLHALIDAMLATLDDRDDGAALAATQVGIMKRIVVIDYKNEFFEMVNPEIISMGGMESNIEGCLSLPGLSGVVPRAVTVKVKYQDRNGIEQIIERSGALARCFQHEIDHLDGILYIDKMEEEFVKRVDSEVQLSVEELKKKSYENVL
ncbi:MAG: peptide deformylase [Ignavibacteria bacterium]|nr:peptide deformylase [Ignavibacteria bacterium]